jgi:hypothetical protein
VRVTVATICREKSGQAGTMLAALKQVASHGLRACVADRDSSDHFLRQIEDMGHEVIRARNGLRGQMEAAFEHAAASGSHVLYFESDKLQFAESGVLPTIRRYRRRGLQYAVAGRTKPLLETFPLAQRVIEIAQSELMAATLGRPGDWIGGPALMTSEHVRTLRDSRLYGTSDHGWGVPWYLLGRAWRDGMNIGIIQTATGVSPHAIEEFNPGYRLFQANSILGSFYEGAGVPYDWVEATAR